MSEFTLRPARKEDCRQVAELYRMSSDGVSDYIWTSIAEPGENILDVGERRYQREDSMFSYRNAVVVEKDDEIVGMLVSFPMVIDEDYEEADPVLAPYSVLEEADSYYVCSMAVLPDFRGHGIGGKLLELAELKSREHDLNKLSLIVFEANTGAKRLYERSGYLEKDRATVVPHPLIHHEGDAILMVKYLRAD